MGKNGEVTNIGTPILPDLTFNFNISLKNQNGNAEPNLTNFRYPLISPFHYSTPQNTLEPFPITLQGTFIAAYNSLGTAPYGSYEFNRTGEGINTNTQDAYPFMSSNDQMISIASLPNDYIYVLYLNKSKAGNLSLISQQGNYDNNYANLTNSNLTNTSTINTSKQSISLQGSTPTITATFNPATRQILIQGTGFIPTQTGYIIYYIVPDVGSLPSPSVYMANGEQIVQTGTAADNIGSSGTFTKQITLQSSLTNYPYAIFIEENINGGLSSNYYYSNYQVISSSPSIVVSYSSGSSIFNVQGQGFTPNNAVTLQYEITSTTSSGGFIPGVPDTYGTTTVESDSTGGIQGSLPVYSLPLESYNAIIYGIDKYTGSSSNRVTITINSNIPSSLSPNINSVSISPSTNVATISGTDFIPNSYSIQYDIFNYKDIYQNNGGVPSPSSAWGVQSQESSVGLGLPGVVSFGGITPVQSGTISSSSVNFQGNLSAQISLKPSLTNYPYVLLIRDVPSSSNFNSQGNLVNYFTNYALITPTPTISAQYNAQQNTISVTGTNFAPNNAVSLSYEILSTSSSGGFLPGAPHIYANTKVISSKTGSITATLPVYVSSNSYIASITAINSYTGTASNRVNIQISASSTKEKSLGTYEIAVFRVINNTYFNATIPLPSNDISCSSESSCQSTWNTEWNNYWSTIIDKGGGNIKQVGNIPLNINDIVNPTSDYRAFNLYNISLDYQGDIFIASTETYQGQTSSLIMKYVNKNQVSPTTGTLNTLYCASITCLIPSFNYEDTINNSQLNEIAVSPNGAQVYLASPSIGAIYVFSGNDLSYDSTINLGFYKDSSGAPPNTSTSSASSTPALATLNIYYWLDNGGLYGQTPSWLSNYNFQPTYDLDKNAFHRPLAIRDINGYLYVLDNWAGIIGYPTQGSTTYSSIFSSAAQGIYFNVLMLRVINSTGYDVPIQPTNFNDMFQQDTCAIANPSESSTCYANVPPSSYCTQSAQNSGTSCIPVPITSLGSRLYCTPGSIFSQQSQYQFQCVSSGTLSPTYYQTASSSLYPSNTFPPYGWILSAVVSGYNGGNTQDSLSLFGASQYYLTSTQKWVLPGYSSEEGYYPIGPEMPPLECKSGFTSNSCVVPQLEGVGFSINYNNTIAILADGGTGNPSGSIANLNYGELIISRFNIFNYTNVGGGVNFVCYSGIPISVASGVGPCQIDPQLFGGKEPGLPILSPPIYLGNNPFNYYESLGAQKVFQYANNLYSTYTSGKGSPSAVESSNYNQQCINEVTNGLTPTNCVNGYPTTLPLTSITSGITSVSVSNPIPPSVPVLESSISGFSIVPYAYQTTMKESWTNFQLIGGLPYCPDSLPPIYYQETKVNYGYIPTAQETSSALAAPIEGGKSYLSYENAYQSGYYVPNLSDIGVYLSPEIFLNVSSNRLFSSLYVNATESPNTNKQYILNATQQLNFIINFNKIGSNMALETITSKVVSLTTPSASNLPYTNNVPITVGLSYTPLLVPPPGFGTINLFNWYQQIVYDSPIQLYLNGSFGNIPYGYHRLIYVFKDRFNNTIYAPIDADIARLTTINLNVTPVVDPANANETTLTINGIAGYYSVNALGNNFYPLTNGNVYLYYGQNINYNGINSKLTSGPDSLYQTELCAFGTPGSPGYPSQCSLADPLDPSQQNYGDIITYSPQFMSNGQCPTAQQSIINIQQSNCNIYTNAICPTGSQGQTQYCEPISTTGNGICTSQLGLMDVAKTNNNGQFSYTTTACGISQVQITAEYYGYPSPEPTLAQQSYLPNAANPSSTQYVTFSVYNYSWMPNQTITLAQIGLFELSYGDLSLLGILSIITIVVLSIILRKRSHKRRVNKSNKNSKGINKRLRGKK